MVRAKGKAHRGSHATLIKAIRTSCDSKTKAPIDPKELNTTCLNFKAAAAVSEFSLEDRGLDTKGKAVGNKASMKTVFAGESFINVEHRVRVGSIPIGAPLNDEAFIAEQLSVESFTAVSPSLAKRLMPRRPTWSFELSSGRLHHRETQAFKDWLEDIRSMIADRGGYPPAFEQNLQVWRQLWRVLERCHVAVVVVDVRHPLLHLPPALVYHVSVTLKKPLVVVLNKLDTVSPEEALSWAECIRAAIPGVAGVTGFSKDASLNPKQFLPLGTGKEALIEECHRVFQTWAEEHGYADQLQAKVDTPTRGEAEAGDLAGAGDLLEDGRVVMGLVGHPNVGKSSLVNSIMGGKVVSVKATPGHTKTLQTMLLDERTCLCDSPGVVFPRLEVPREAQIVGMLIPLAQVREPYSALRWVMEHCKRPLPDLLGLKAPTLARVIHLQELGINALDLSSTDAVIDDNSTLPWSPMLVCAQYAQQRGLVRSGGPDAHRAGMEILEKVLDGRVAYSTSAPENCARMTIEKWLATEGGDINDPDDWQVDDNDYESEVEDAQVAEIMAKGDLLGLYGKERQHPGSGSINSRKKQAKVQKKFAAVVADEKLAAEQEQAREKKLAAEEAAGGEVTVDGDGLHWGLRVEIHGLMGRPELNGKAGLLEHFDKTSGRWQVAVEDDIGAKKIKAKNLRVRASPDVPEASAQTNADHAASSAPVEDP